MIIVDFIAYFSWSVFLVSFVGYYYAEHKKEQVSDQKGRELSPEETKSGIWMFDYDDEGNQKPVYAKTDEQIKWDLYASLFGKGIWFSLLVIIIFAMILGHLGIIEFGDPPLDDRY
tara:strand:- start:662 stop:1009 length:348 start_codon:yes stop_codon:yes gene_type:complete